MPKSGASIPMFGKRIPSITTRVITTGIQTAISEAIPMNRQLPRSSRP